MVNADKSAGNKCFYIFDGQHHETIDKAADFLKTNFGAPESIITCNASDEEIQNRFKEKNEIADDLGDEDKQAL